MQYDELHRRLALTPAAVDRLLAVALAATAVGALASATIAGVVAARRVVRAAALLTAGILVATASIAAAGSPIALRVLLVGGALAVAPVLSLARAVHLDQVLGSVDAEGTRVDPLRSLASSWVATASGASVAGAATAGGDLRTWQVTFVVAAALLIAAVVVVPRRAEAAATPPEPGPLVQRSSLALTAFGLGIALVGPAGIALGLLNERGAPPRAIRWSVLASGAAICLVVFAFLRPATRRVLGGPTLARAAQGLAIIAAVAAAAGAAASTSGMTLMFWSLSIIAAAGFACASEAALLPERAGIDRHGTAGLLVAVVGSGGAITMASMHGLAGVSAPWLVAGAALPLVVAAVGGLVTAG